MAPTRSEWICRFQVETPTRHRKGFTIYKLTSLVYPLNAPEAATKLVVWKRYSDFKGLHKKIKEACKTFNVTENPPALLKGSFFNRFEEDVIKERVQSTQALLDFIGRHKTLFLGDTVQNFCEVGYNVSDKGMGQAPVSGLDGGEDNIWRWSDDVRWRSDVSQDSSSFLSESSEEEGLPHDGNRVTEASNPLLHNNNNLFSTQAEQNNRISPKHSNNNSLPLEDNSSIEDQNLQLNEESLEVEDPAGPGDKPLARPPAEPSEENTEVICQSERPINTTDVWLSLPSAEERLSAYRVVGILDRVLVVVHRACPTRRLILKVLRKSSWPVAPMEHIREPRPIPHMVRLFDYVETDDAVFMVLEYATRGLLWDHKIRMQERRAPPSLTEVKNVADVDVETILARTQSLLASVTRTLQQSEVAASVLDDELNDVETKLLNQSSHKPRSASVTPRPHLERRYSCGDGKNHRPRTAHASLDRSVRWTRFPEESVRSWATELVAAIDTLHARGVIWKDLHPDNVMVGQGGKLLLTFQHRWRGVEKPLHPQALVGLFVAPEVRSVFPVTPAADWWSVGVLLYKLFTGVALVEVHPYGIGSHTSIELPDFLSLEAKNLLTELLQFEPLERLGSGMNGAEEIRCHAFFAEVDWESAYKLDKDV